MWNVWLLTLGNIFPPASKITSYFYNYFQLFLIQNARAKSTFERDSFKFQTGAIRAEKKSWEKMSNKMLQKIILGSTSRCLAAQVPKNIAHNVDRYSKYSPSPLSVQQFLDFGKLVICVIFDKKNLMKNRLFSDLNCYIFFSYTGFANLRFQNKFLIQSKDTDRHTVFK